MSNNQKYTYAPINQVSQSYAPQAVRFSSPQGQPNIENRNINYVKNNQQVTNSYPVPNPSSFITFGQDSVRGSIQQNRISVIGSQSTHPNTLYSFNNQPPTLQSPQNQIKNNAVQQITNPFPKKLQVSNNQKRFQLLNEYKFNPNQFKTVQEDQFASGCCECFSPVKFQSNSHKSSC